MAVRKKATRRKPARLVKGSAAAKRHMAKIRAMRKNPSKKTAPKTRRRVARKTTAKRSPVRRRKNPATKATTKTVSRSKKLYNSARSAMLDIKAKTGLNPDAYNMKASHTPTHYRWVVKTRKNLSRKKNPAGRPKRTVKKASAQASSPMYRTKPSQTSGRKPSRRLMNRRARNTRPGTFPNPTQHVIFGVRKTDGQLGYFNGMDAFETSKSKAISYPSFQTAVSAARQLAKKAGTRYVIGAASRNATVSEIRKKVEG